MKVHAVTNIIKKNYELIEFGKRSNGELGELKCTQKIEVCLDLQKSDELNDD